MSEKLPTEAMIERLGRRKVRHANSDYERGWNNALDEAQSLAKLIPARPTDAVERVALRHLESEARRFAGFYEEGSDGRNTFVIFANKIAALTDTTKEG